MASLWLSGVPPLGCFAGEWLLVQALILGFAAGDGSMRLLAPFSGAGLALATALSAAALVKLYGIGFLGRPRSEAAARARPAPAALEVWLLLLAALGLAWGLASPLAVASLSLPISSVIGPGFDAHTLAGIRGPPPRVPPRRL